MSPRAVASRAVRPTRSTRSAASATRLAVAIAHPTYTIEPCPRCGYPEADGGYCPECGTTTHRKGCKCSQKGERT